MRYYGQMAFGVRGEKFKVMRYESVPNQWMYSLPNSYSNTTFRARPTAMYLCNDSGPITVTECETDNSLVGITLQPGNVYQHQQLFGNNIVRLETGNTVPIVTILNGNNISNVSIVEVNGSFSIPINTYSILVEGTIEIPVYSFDANNTVTVSNTTLDSNADVYVLNSMLEERQVSGSGKLLLFQNTDG